MRKKESIDVKVYSQINHKCFCKIYNEKINV